MIRNRSPHAGPTSVDDPDAPRARILIVDADDARAKQHRDAIEIAGFPEPERAVSGDDALDILGAMAQRFDIVAMWAPLADHAGVDFAGVLRRCQSPVRLAVMTDLSPRDYPSPGRLAGACALEGRSGERGMIGCLRRVQLDGAAIADIQSGRQVPAMLDQVWALAIYGAPPGSRIVAALD